MHIIKRTATSTKNFVTNHKVGLAFVAGMLLVGHNAKKTFEGYDKFLKEHDLYDEYMSR